MNGGTENTMKYDEAKKVRYLVITAAGQGTRMRVVNKHLPKEMLPIKNKPAILYAFEEGISAGIEHTIIITSKEKKSITKLFSDEKKILQYYEADVLMNKYLNTTKKISIIYQSKVSGEAGAILEAEEIIDNNPFAVIYPDDIHFPERRALKYLCDYYQMLEQNIIGLMEVTNENCHAIGNSGKVKLSNTDMYDDLYKIEEFKDKTRSTYVLSGRKKELRACGIMVYRRGLFSHIKNMTSEIKDREFTDLILRRKMMDKGELFFGIKLKTDCFDIGNPMGYRYCLKNNDG
jgi:UTP--glucose-1-phosphate uridylyltransferase